MENDNSKPIENLDDYNAIAMYAKEKGIDTNEYVNYFTQDVYLNNFGFQYNI